MGKSTLLNQILGQKLVITTAKPGTTRTSVIGVYASHDPPSQIAFVDTPGLTQPKSALHKVLVEQAQQGLAKADVIVFLTEVSANSAISNADEGTLEVLKAVQCPVLLAINKIDRLKNKEVLLPFLETYQKKRDFEAIIPLSALKGTNIQPLIAEIQKRLPRGTLYDDDVLTDKPVRFFAAEFVREAVLKRTHKEVPYGTAVVIESYQEHEDLTRIHATIVVEKDSHKGIVIGAGGKRIKRIGIEARKSMESFLGHRVHLELWVKVIAGWTADPNRVRQLATQEEL